jgi:hypothetical protein
VFILDFSLIYTVVSHCLKLGWVEFLSKSRTSLCINIYNLTPVESNSDELKFRLSRIKVLVPRCKKPYYLHSLSRNYLSKHVYYLGIKIGSQLKHPVIEWHFYLRLFHMFISQSVKLISDNIWIGLVLWHRLDVYNQKLSIHNKCRLSRHASMIMKCTQRKRFIYWIICRKLILIKEDV